MYTKINMNKILFVPQIDLSKPFTATTQSGAQYQFGDPDTDGNREITRNGQPHYRGRVMGSGITCFMGGNLTNPDEIIEGQGIFVATIENGANKPWITTPIVSASN